MFKIIRNTLIVAVIVGMASIGLIALQKDAMAVDETGEFSLQVSPSPLVVTLKPGETTAIDLKIRNTGSQTEQLKIAPRSFTIDKNTGELLFDDTVEPEAARWTSFQSSSFTVQPGQWHTQKVTFAVPKEAGFSYSFSLIINRQSDVQKNSESGRLLKGTVAIFTLINVDRPGALRELQVNDFTTSQSIYEYLPAELDITFKNTGNTIAQPAGSVFIQRGSDDRVPISTLPVNKASGYVLPDSIRTLKVEWDDGFQVLRPAVNGDSMAKQLTWNWSNLSHLRIGRYTAKLVAVYNDGQRDIPIIREISFWVIPWKLLLGALIIVLLILIGLWSLFRKVMVLPQRKKRIRF